jgi:hypothetical protein
VNPLLLPMLLALLGSLRDSASEPPEAYARPQTTVANYWHCMLERRHLSALECFAHFTPADANEMVPLPDMVELRCRDFAVADRGRGIVDVTYTVEYRVGMGDSLRRFTSGDRLCLTRGGWKIERPLFAARAGH